MSCTDNGTMSKIPVELARTLERGWIAQAVADWWVAGAPEPVLSLIQRIIAGDYSQPNPVDDVDEDKPL